MVQPEPAAVLTAVARLVAEAASLRDAVGRLAATLRGVIQFERLHVLRLDRAELFVLYDVDADGLVTMTEHRIGDSGTMLEPGVEGALSRLVCTVRQGPRVHGAVWLTSAREDAFSAADQALMDGVADLLGLVFEH